VARADRFVLFSLWLVLVAGFVFFEAMLLPLLAAEAPAFAGGFLGVFTGSIGLISWTIAYGRRSARRAAVARWA
jgi:hypothetical protein